MNDDETAIRRVVDRWMSASKSGDIDTVLALMTDDVVFMVPGREPFGKAAFAAAAEDLRDVAMDGTSEILELQVAGDLAFIRNRIEIAVTPPGGTAIRRAGYTLTILRRDADGQWRLARDANLVTAQN